MTPLPSQPTSPRAPKHQRVRETLRRQIMEGLYPPGSALPPETELPKRLRVSKITVVRALNELVREGLVVRRRGRGSFVADPAQRPLIPGRFLKLGVLVPFSVFPDYRYGSAQNEMLRAALATWGMERAEPEFPGAAADQATQGRFTCEPRGCMVSMMGEEVSAHPMHPPLQAVKAAGLDGILTCSIVQEAWMAELLALGIPTVIVDYPAERFILQADQVYFDPLPGYRAAVNHFVAAGLKRIHFVGGLIHKPFGRYEDRPRGDAYYTPEHTQRDPDSFLRLAAWRETMTQHGLDAPESNVHYAWSEGKHAAETALRLADLPADRRPQAVVCHGLGQAQAVLEVFATRGLPVMTAGATDAAGHGPALRIVASNADLGRTAASLLLWKLQLPSRLPLRVGVPMALSKESVR
ncbi:MAG: GntR family transcriptional regulator [Planctomycetota bacterium]|nr:GntR family transcriptional regulator [Planctomycetota bacterium]